MLYVMSTVGELNDFFSFYMVNQRALNLGANSDKACTNPDCYKDGQSRNENCWSAGKDTNYNAGEIDFLEGTFYGDGNVNLNPSNSAGCMMGHNPYESVPIFNMNTSPPTGDNMFAAVVDSTGVTVYHNPTWDGLTTYMASSTLGTSAPTNSVTKTHMTMGGKVIERMENTGQN